TLCLIRGILVFLSAFGTIGGITAAFGLSFNILTVGLAFLAISILICFTYYNKITFYAGYVLMFLAFMVLYVFAYAYINSGFQAFLNEVYIAYSDFFVLPSTRETTEYVADRSLTVPAAMLFTGAGFAILLNISISAYMDLFTTFLLTFLPMQVAFYIDIIPPMPYLVMIITVYITVEVLSRSGRFRLPYRYRKGQQYAVMSEGGSRWIPVLRRRKKTVKYEYLASGRGMIQLSVVSAVIATAMMLILSGMFSGQFKTKYVSNGIKDLTDGYVKMLAQGGFTSLFNRYSATGGISHGKLGGISSVTPDYETDIVVRMVPTSTGENAGGMSDGRLNSLYLKAYTGVYYTKDQFMSAIPGKIGETELLSLDDYVPYGANYMDSGSPAYMKLWLMSVDADNTYDYRPYYTLFSDSRRNLRSTGVPDKLMRYAVAELGAPEEAKRDREDMAAWVNEKKEDPESSPTNYELIYTPYTEGVPYDGNPSITDKYEKSVYDNYLYVPEDISPALKIAAEEAGLNKAGTGSSGEEQDRVDEQIDRLMILQRLKDFYRENYSYSMMPGTTPIDRDTVEYFLTELKRGYCVHFAASSTLILRSMGIPARYVEGYVVNPSDIVEGDIIRDDADRWILTKGVELSDDIALVDVEIPDANAHAWTEVYIDGYGWIPYDFTPPSDEEDLQLGGLADFFARLFSSTERRTGEGDTGVTIPD
ncbi:MAG: transglutaminase domain-containing protein, partial [Lachnospiraceae bacterium]|nr:transglutaminase domain-containing protein [Lachnospiraceae bacterium]